LLKTPGVHFQWPNNVKVVPHDVFGFRAIVVPDGFLATGHKNGGVYIVKVSEDDMTKTEFTTKISTDEKEMFYTMGEWVDLNKDGRMDFLTARSNGNADGGELVWFEHPEEGLGGEWKEHIVTSGPETSIEVVIDGPEKKEIIVFAAEFFSQKLSMYAVSTHNGELNWSRVIDDQILSAYSVQFADLAGNGRRELLVSNHESDKDTNGVFSYTLPKKDWQEGEIEKFTLSTGFKPVNNPLLPLVHRAAPGFTYAFQPQSIKEHHIGNPSYILVAGHGDHCAHLMTPTDPTNFVYERDTIANEKGLVTAMTYGDLDNDGWNEVWATNFEDSKIEVFKFRALEPPSPEFDSQFLQ
jgi:hypothetical protein